MELLYQKFMFLRKIFVKDTNFSNTDKFIHRQTHMNHLRYRNSDNLKPQQLDEIHASCVARPRNDL